MNTVFYVMARGVYEHGPLGIYTDLDAAKARCERHVADKEKWMTYEGYDIDYEHMFNGDGWHDYVVYTSDCNGGNQKFAVALKYNRKTKKYEWRHTDEWEG